MSVTIRRVAAIVIAVAVLVLVVARVNNVRGYLVSQQTGEASLVWSDEEVLLFAEVREFGYSRTQLQLLRDVVVAFFLAVPRGRPDAIRSSVVVTRYAAGHVESWTTPRTRLGGISAYNGRLFTDAGEWSGSSFRPIGPEDRLKALPLERSAAPGDWKQYRGLLAHGGREVHIVLPLAEEALTVSVHTRRSGRDVYFLPERGGRVLAWTVSPRMRRLTRRQYEELFGTSEPALGHDTSALWP